MREGARRCCCDLDELAGAVGWVLGPTQWFTVGTRDVAGFARATGAPGGEVPAAGDVPPWLLLSLTNRFLPDLLTVTGGAGGANYGTGPVRFPAPVPVGSRLRAVAEVVAVDDVAGGVQAIVRVTQEVEGREAPACVVDTISRYLR